MHHYTKEGVILPVIFQPHKLSCTIRWSAAVQQRSWYLSGLRHPERDRPLSDVQQNSLVQLLESNVLRKNGSHRSRPVGLACQWNHKDRHWRPGFSSWHSLADRNGPKPWAIIAEPRCPCPLRRWSGGHGICGRTTRVPPQGIPKRGTEDKERERTREKETVS